MFRIVHQATNKKGRQQEVGFNEKRTGMSSHILVFCCILKSTFKCSASICYSKRDSVRKLDLFAEFAMYTKREYPGNGEERAMPLWPNLL